MMLRLTYCLMVVGAMALLGCQSREKEEKTCSKPDEVFKSAMTKLQDSRIEDFLQDVDDKDVERVGKDKMIRLFQQKLDGKDDVVRGCFVDSVEYVDDNRATIFYFTVTNGNDTTFYQQKMMKVGNQWKLKLI